MIRTPTLVAGMAMGLLAVATLFSGRSPVGASEQSTIEIHHRLCPTDQAITDYFTDCHSHLLGQSFAFTVISDDGEQTVETDADTSNTFASVTAGPVEIFGGVPGEFATTFVYCSQDQVAIDVEKTDIGVSFEAPPGDIVCDWYNTPIDLKGDDGGVTTLPNSGLGVSSTGTSDLSLALLTGLGTILGATAIARRRHA